MKEYLVIPIPDSISDEGAAQSALNPSTLIGMLQDLDVPKGEFVIITAAGSVLGRCPSKTDCFQVHRHLFHKF